MANGNVTAWRKSSHSYANGNCVEVAEDGPLILVRDSKNPAGPMLTFGWGAWHAFIRSIRARELPLS
jgi:Domain of unknown function (DUF397)